jgi:predicted outer membrane repeat protein
MLFAGSTGRVVNSVFAQNSSTAGGASIDIEGELHIVHSTIADTILNPHPAIFFEIGTLYVTDTTITSHTVGIQLPPLATGAREDYNLFFGNLTNTVGVITGSHSLVGDPKFIDPLNGNYHLQFGSVAIDHGVDAGVYTDLDGNPRPFGAGFDIGAYEFAGGPRYVATTGNDTGNDCLNETNPCATVQHAIDVANNDDRVLIASGLYTQSATLYKPVSLTGENRDTTILHAVAGQRGLTVTGAMISNSVVISGLTFTGGAADYGGGMLITSTAQPLIHNSIFISNAASSNGGGIYAQGDLALLDSDILSNTATEFGGGVFAVQSLTVTNCDLIGNYTTGMWPAYFPHGGGIYAQTNVFIANSRFIANGSQFGGGLENTGPMLTMIDTDFIANAGGGVIAGSYNDGGYIRIIRGEFANHSSGQALTAYNTLEITGTQFTNNSNRDSYAAGVNVHNSSATIVNARFENNDCTECSAGGLYFYGFRNDGNVPLTLSSTVFISNSPGGAYIYQSSMITVAGSRFENNSTPSYGGALWAYDSPLMMINTEVISNTAVDGPGGVTAHPTTVLIDSRVEGNASSGSYGGGLWTGELFLTNTNFINNSAAAGGGVLARKAYLNGGRFERNTAQVYGVGSRLLNCI